MGRRQVHLKSVASNGALTSPVASLWRVRLDQLSHFGDIYESPFWVDI